MQCVLSEVERLLTPAYIDGIIKSLMDALGIAGVAEISFLSGCTVLSMSCYTVIKSLTSEEKTVDLRIATPLALGAAVNKKIDHKTVDKLFNVLIVIIVFISCYNAWRFLSQ